MQNVINHDLKQKRKTKTTWSEEKKGGMWEAKLEPTINHWEISGIKFSTGNILGRWRTAKKMHEVLGEKKGETKAIAKRRVPTRCTASAIERSEEDGALQSRQGNEH